MSTLFCNAHIVSAGLDLPGGAMLVRENRIAGLYAEADALPDAGRRIDLAGKYLLPGFIDIHFHGRGNRDFADASDDAFRTIARGKLSEGVTSFLATTLSVSRENITEICRAAARYAAKPEYGRLLGIHLEGPFFNPAGAGAQNPEYLLEPDIGLVEEWNRIFPVKKVSFSPELPDGIGFTRQLAELGIMPSGAHSTADYDCFQLARCAGMKHLTHFCNVMTPLHHLRPGMVGGGLLADDVFVEIIADGIHLTDEMLRVILRIKGAERVILITDAMRASGMPDGNYTLGGLDVIVWNRKAVLPAGPVAGSLLQYSDGLKRLRSLRIFPDSGLIRCAGFNQALSLGISGVGELKTGNFADFVVVDEEWTPLSVWCDGVERYSKADDPS